MQKGCKHNSPPGAADVFSWPSERILALSMNTRPPQRVVFRLFTWRSQVLQRRSGKEVKVAVSIRLRVRRPGVRACGSSTAVRKARKA
jgi:hypothetical protein